MRQIMLSVLASAMIGAAPAPSVAPDTAGQLFAAGDFGSAAAAYAAELNESPNDETAQLGLGAIELYQNDLTDAEPLLQAVATKDPANARAASLLKELHRRQSEASKRVTIAGGITQVPFIVADPLPVIYATINGKRGTFVVDTGGTVDLDTSFAQSLGLKLESAGMGTFAGGQHAPLASSTIDSITLGGATAYDMPVSVLPMPAKLFPMQIDGIIGTTLFERFLVTIDYPRDRLVIRPRDASERFLADAQAANATIEPCWLVGDHFVFAKASVNNTPQVLYLFDSGLAGGGLMPSAQLISAARLDIDLGKAGTGIGGAGTLAAIPFVAQSIAVGNAIQHNVRGIYTPGGTPFGIFPFIVWGGISDLYLRHYAYTVDFEAMKLILTPQ
ncbi:MAG: aspartyl protease family protein [Candidatus Cybelea sp.]